MKRAQKIEENILKVRNFFIEFTKKVISLNGVKLSYDLSLSKIKALSAFTEDRPFTMGELAKNAGVTLPSMTDAIDKLVQENLVERKRDENDRRIVLVKLTEKGKKMRKEFMMKRREELLNIFSRLSDEEMDELATSLDKVRTILEKLSI
ncbi:MAG: MarR family transcriptional regulator [Candidatus Schekmanbacteria bacterium]|nr:MAG: MarR family transcriptional regulator [Candidatus Schekmanbacteria bacterium]